MTLPSLWNPLPCLSPPDLPAQPIMRCDTNTAILLGSGLETLLHGSFPQELSHHMCTCTIRWTYSWRIVSDRLEVFPVSYGTFRIGMAPIRQCTVRMSAASEGYQHPLKPSVDSCEMTVVV